MGQNTKVLWSLKFTLRCRLNAAIRMCQKNKIACFVF